MEHPFSTLSRRVDDIYFKLDRLGHCIDNLCNELGVHSNKKKLSLLLSDLELNMNTVIQTLGINTGKKMSIRLDNIERQIEEIKHHNFDTNYKLDNLSNQVNLILMLPQNRIKEMNITENISGVQPTIYPEGFGS
jgi:hypothetical protein